MRFGQQHDIAVNSRYVGFDKRVNWLFCTGSMASFLVTLRVECVDNALVAYRGNERRGVSMAECPECAARVPVQDVLQGEILPCPECGADLEVVAVSPEPKLALAPQEEEDWGE